MPDALTTRQMHLLQRVQRLGRLGSAVVHQDDLPDIHHLVHLGLLVRTMNDDYSLTQFGADYLRRAVAERR